MQPIDSKNSPTVPNKQGLPISLTMAEERAIITPAEDEVWSDSQSDTQYIDLHSDDQEDIKEVSGPILGQLKEELKKMEIADKNAKKKYVPKIETGPQFKHEAQHTIDRKFKRLLWLMKKDGMVDLLEVTGLKQGRLVLSNRDEKVSFRTVSKEVADLAINRLSDFIDNLEILCTNIKGKKASLLSKSLKVKEMMKKNNMILFNYRDKKGEEELNLGGLAKKAKLKEALQTVKSFHLADAFLRKFLNRRSYVHILNIIMNSKHMEKQMKPLFCSNLIEINQNREERCIRVIYNNSNFKHQIVAAEFQNFMETNISRFYSVVFILKCQKIQPSLFSIPEVPEINISLIPEKKLGLTFLYFIAPKKIFIDHRQEICRELEKVQETIIGVRHFNYIQPLFTSIFYDFEKYYALKFPKAYPYSMSVYAKKDQFDWRWFMQEITRKKMDELK